MIKLTKREKIMLIVLAVVVCIATYYEFVLDPQFYKIAQLSAQEADYHNKVVKIQSQIDPDQQVIKDYKILNAKISQMTKSLFPIIYQEKNILILDDMLKTSELQVYSISFGKTELGPIRKNTQSVEMNSKFFLKQLAEQYSTYKNLIDISQDENKAVDDMITSKAEEDIDKNHLEDMDHSIEQMTMTITFRGRYDRILQFMQQVENYYKKIIIRSIDLAADTSGLLRGSIVLDFYAIPKLDMQDENYLKWELENIYGKDNPFAPLEGYSTITFNTLGNEDVLYEKQYDFGMTVQPISADVPSVILGKTSDYTGKTYIYADNEGDEEVVFQLTQKDNQYFYRYATESQVYPENNEEGMNFQPTGREVSLKVVSDQRNGEEDKSGIRLRLINQTDLNLKADIIHDDSKRPRVKIEEKVGTIQVNR